MFRQRLLAIVTGSALAAGGTAVAAHAAIASDNGDQRPETTTAGPATPQQVTRTIPGVGTVTFTVDPATGAITNVMVMPVTGVTAGTPVVGHKQISIPITLADGTMQTLRVQVNIEDDHTVVRVRTELKNEPDIEAVEVERPEAAEIEHPEAPEAEAPEAPEAPEAEHPEAPEVENHGANTGDHSDGQPATTAPSGGDHSGGDHSGGGSSDDGGHSDGSGGGGSDGGGH